MRMTRMVFGGNMKVSPCDHSHSYNPPTNPPFLLIPLIPLFLSPYNLLYARTAVDYILFATKDVSLDPNPNEVSDARYVTEKELREMFEDKGTSSHFRTPKLFADSASSRLISLSSAFMISHHSSLLNLNTPVRPLTPQPTCSPHGSNSSATTSSSPGGNSC
jgi:hypothetical protein